MGGAQSKDIIQYFSDVASAESPPDEKDFLEHLGRYKEDICSGDEYYSISLPFLQRVFPACIQGKRLQWLFHVCLRQMEHASCNYNQEHNEAFLSCLHIVEYIIRYIHQRTHGNMTELLSIIKVENMTEHKSPAGEVGGIDWSCTDLNKLCCGLMHYCVSVPLLHTTIEVHNKVVNLLLSMNSSALYHRIQHNHHPSSGAVSDVCTEMILSHKELPSFLSLLLKRFMSWGMNELAGQSDRKYSLRTLYNFFLFPRRKSKEERGEEVAGGRSSISSSGGRNLFLMYGESYGRHCTQLLMVLLIYCKGIKGNPALEFIKTLEDRASSNPQEKTGGGDDDGREISYKLLLLSIKNKLHVCPSLCILLYTLLYDHPTFLYTCITSYSKEVLDVIQEILCLNYKVIAYNEADNPSAKTLPPPPADTTTTTTNDDRSYSISVLEDTPESLHRIGREMAYFSYPFISFMCSTIILLFSQDQTINKYMNDIIIEPHFKVGTCKGKISLSSLCMLVLVHSIVKAINEKNEALAAVFIPSLLNLSPFVSHIDSYTSQQVIKLLLLLLRKLKRFSGKMAYLHVAIDGDDSANGNNNNNNNNNNGGDVDAAAAQMFLRQLSPLVEAMEIMLQGEDKHNDILVYELLYSRGKLQDGISVDGACAELSSAYKIFLPVLRIAEYYETELASVTSAETFQEILNVIRRATRERAGLHASSSASTSTKPTGGSGGGGASWKAREIIYIYEESPHSYDFFGPFVWATLLSDAAHPGGLLWATDTTPLDIFPQ